MQLGLLAAAAAAAWLQVAASVAVPRPQERSAAPAAQLGAGISAIETSATHRRESSASPAAREVDAGGDDEEGDAGERQRASERGDSDDETSSEDADAHEASALRSAGAPLEASLEPASEEPAPKVSRYGPAGCISVWSDPKAHCVVRTSCKEHQLDQYAVTLFCLERNGSKTRHVFEEGAFDAEETFDTEIRCHRCVGAEEHKQLPPPRRFRGTLPTPGPAWGPAPNDTATAGTANDTQSVAMSLEQLMDEVSELKAGLAGAAHALQALNDKVLSPDFRLPPPEREAPAPPAVSARVEEEDEEDEDEEEEEEGDGEEQPEGEVVEQSREEQPQEEEEVESEDAEVSLVRDQAPGSAWKEDHGVYPARRPHAQQQQQQQLAAPLADWLQQRGRRPVDSAEGGPVSALQRARTSRKRRHRAHEKRGAAARRALGRRGQPRPADSDAGPSSEPAGVELAAPDPPAQRVAAAAEQSGAEEAEGEGEGDQ